MSVLRPCLVTLDIASRVFAVGAHNFLRASKAALQ